jgi:hypothetical protein
MKAKQRWILFSSPLFYILVFVCKYESLDTFWFIFVQFVIYVCKHIIIEEGHDNWWVSKGWFRGYWRQGSRWCTFNIVRNNNDEEVKIKKKMERRSLFCLCFYVFFLFATPLCDE